jgi:hypothetical protein
MDSNLIATIEDQIEILSLRIEKLRKQFDNLDKVVSLHLLNSSSKEEHNRKEVDTRGDCERC